MKCNKGSACEWKHQDLTAKTLKTLAESKGYTVKKGKGKGGAKGPKSAVSETQSVAGSQGGQSNYSTLSKKEKAKAKAKTKAAAKPAAKAKATPSLGGPDWCQRYLTQRGCDGNCGKAHLEQPQVDDIVRAGRLCKQAQKAAAAQGGSAAGPAVVAQ